MTKQAELSKAEKLAASYLSALPAQPELQENSKQNQNLELSSKREKLRKIAEEVIKQTIGEIHWADLMEITGEDGLTEDEVSEVLEIIRSAKVVIPNG